MKNKMFLICGMPGSGKTHFAKKFATHNHIKYLNIDDFYAKVNGDESNRNNKFEVWIEFFKAIHEVGLAGKDVVVETMALTRFNRKELTAWFPAFEHHMIYIDCDYFVCLKNVQKRKRKIDVKTMSNFYAKLEPPFAYEEEEWESRIEIRNINGGFYYPTFGFVPDGSFPMRMLRKVIENDKNL